VKDKTLILRGLRQRSRTERSVAILRALPSNSLPLGFRRFDCISPSKGIEPYEVVLGRGAGGEPLRGGCAPTPPYQTRTRRAINCMYEIYWY
jgi:hypothetical protein